MRKKTSQYHSALGFLGPLKGANDEFMGAGIGLAGALAAKWALKQSWAASFAAMIPAPVMSIMPVLGAAAAGAAAYYGGKKSAKAKAHFVGAAAAGAALTAYDWLKAQFPTQFSDVVALKLNGYSYGLPINDPNVPFHGLIVNDSNHALNELAAMSMGDQDMDYDY